MATPEDVERSVLSQLPNIVEMHNLSDFSHLDFIWGLRAGYEIYRPVEQFIHRDYWTAENQWL
ncbi:Lipase [Trichuris trichiura]|uniref:Lipase n=1 Tax=Trichuris trichiura TaxID=36087 RepID=A0A077ZM04_TRITR|nr:Lipase [Trichuris trichiura]